MTRNHQHHCPMGVQKPPYPPSGNASNVPMIPRRWSMPRNCEKQTGPKIRKFSGQSWKHHENIMKTSWKHHENIMETSWKHHENIMETSWKHHGNIMKTSFNWRYQICVWVLKSVLDGCACVCVVLQNDMHYRMMVELMNWYVMVSCHVPCHATKDSSPRFPQHLSRANTVPLRWCDVFFLSHAAAASHERWDMMGWLLDVNGIPDTWW